MDHISIRNLLFETMDQILERREEFLISPKSSFTRSRLISFRQAMTFPMVIGKGDLEEETRHFFPHDKCVTLSALIQQRNKIKSSAFRTLFDKFTGALPAEQCYEGMRIIAVDGSRLNLLYNPKDKETFRKDIKNRKGINQLHLNAMYDVMNHFFIDAELQTVNGLNEKDAFITMLNRYSFDQTPTLFILDRGYCSYNVIANLVHSNHLFLIRSTSVMIKSIFGKNNEILFAQNADCQRKVIVGRSRKYRHLENYQWMKSGGKYDFLEKGSRETDTLTFRVLKFPLSAGNDEYIITNLPMDKFNTDKIKELYFKRWKIETAFRDLKYSCGLSAIHSLKKELITQEIFAKLTMYNYSSATIQAAGKPVIRKSKEPGKYKYCINVRKAIQQCMDHLKTFEKELVKKLHKNKTARRPGRSFQRNMRRQSSVPSCYR